MSTRPFGSLLRELRHDRGISQVDLAHTIGVTPSYISAVERGRKPPLSVEKTLKVIKALGFAGYGLLAAETLLAARDPGRGVQLRFTNGGRSLRTADKFKRVEDLSGQDSVLHEWVKDGDDWLLRIYHLPKVKEGSDG